MGLPACRIGDMTEHGGVVMVGFPTVLIGEMPASRIGDMHVCPMVTPGVPPIPHVGGPFVLGSPTVIVGMMPQSRVTDMLVCVGPPDQAVLGCMTVLVGMAGGAGAAGAAAGAAAMAVPVPAASPAASSSQSKTTSAVPQIQATRQPDGSIQTASTIPGNALPPVTLKQPGWPDLPAENTTTFSSVQPATVLPGTNLYAANDGENPGSNSYWSTEPPGSSTPAAGPGGSPDQDAGASTDPDAGANTDPNAGANPTPAPDPYAAPGDADPIAAALSDPASTAAKAAEKGALAYARSGNAAAALAQASPALGAATHVAVLAVTSPEGLKAWAGTPAGQAAAQGLLVYAPPAAAGAVATVQQFRLPPAPAMPRKR